MTENGTSLTATDQKIAIVAAVAANGVIGRDNRLIWRLRTDLKRFRRLTIGKPVIMGRKTYESIGRPLPDRVTLVLSRDPSFRPEGVVVFADLDEALEAARRIARESGQGEVMIAGGAELYALTLPMADRIYLTEVALEPEGDAFFPAFDRGAFEVMRRDSFPPSLDDEAAFTFLDLERRNSRVALAPAIAG